MPLSKLYEAKSSERDQREKWLMAGIYDFEARSDRPVFSIDTPPPTVSGRLHLGHVYSYSHVDFIARFRRMQGFNVFYPMGYDDNGLPTERLVEKNLGISAQQVGRACFIEKCLEVSEQAEAEYQQLWQRLGLSIDWRYTYRTIDDRSRRISQLSFLELYHKGIAYRMLAPAIWCRECHTTLAQADLNEIERESEFVTLRFEFNDGNSFLPIATTRPELLPACVAVFVHPEDTRYQAAIGRELIVPLFGGHITVRADRAVDPGKGSGAVMCCTFGDTTDITWWRTHHLPTIEAIDREGRMTGSAGELAGLTIAEARREIKRLLKDAGLILDRMATFQTVRVHERCDTPVEYVNFAQWFIRLLDQKEALLQSGEGLRWHPEAMHARYRSWVENLNWDWCISRQRYFGVPIPVWYCTSCGETIVADEEQLPVDPLTSQPARPCKCGSLDFKPDEDVQDTWATSSLSPQIVGHWPAGEPPVDRAEDPPVSGLYEQVFPFSLRPQAHEIIRTWAFYTIAKSNFQFNSLPWQEVLISGWGLAGEGMGKISKSRGGGPLSPLEMIERYSADAVRYWAASTGPGKDAVISEEKIQNGSRLVNKLWNVARFCERFAAGYDFPTSIARGSLPFTPADRWVLAGMQKLVKRATGFLEDYDYASAKNEIEAFFWHSLADNYLEMCKQRLYIPQQASHEAARFALLETFRTLLKLFAPFLPYITDQIYTQLFMDTEAGLVSIHQAAWPEPLQDFEDEQASSFGELLLEMAGAVRRYKSEHNLPLGSEIRRLQLVVNCSTSGQGTTSQGEMVDELKAALPDLESITRALQVEFPRSPDAGLQSIYSSETISLYLEV